MMDSAEPLCGWDIAETLPTNTGNAANDLYGKLFVHLRSALWSFRTRLSEAGVNFELYNLDATELPKTLAGTAFARIEVWSGACIEIRSMKTKHIQTSNISDGHFIGPHRTVRLLGPLLQTPAQNPHATLITLFMNAVVEADNKNEASARAAAEKVMKNYPNLRNKWISNPALFIQVMMAAMPIGKEVDKIFAE
jgi:hypothetical protein